MSLKQLQDWCHGTEGIYVLEDYILPDGGLLPCVVRRKRHPHLTADVFAPARVAMREVAM